MHARPEGEEVRSPYDIVLRLISVKTVLARPERKKLENRYGIKMQIQFAKMFRPKRPELLARPKGGNVRSAYDIVLLLISVKTVFGRPEKN